MKKHLLWLAFFVMMPQFLKAQTIDLVKDINDIGPTMGITVYISAVTENKLFFLGYDDAHGYQLWRSDGTTAGTIMLTDIFNNNQEPPTSLKAANGLALFNIFYHGEMWLFRSDGTKEGTFPLNKVNITPYGVLNSILEINNTIYYSAGYAGYELWKTDGTVEGTSLVKFLSGPNAFDFFNFNGTLYFATGSVFEEGSHRLWKSDGTAAGTVVGPALEGIRFRPTVLDGYMYFCENNKLKRTDGTTITIVKSFPVAGDPVTVGTSIYLPAGEDSTGIELWKSDGTTAGTVLLKDIVPGTVSSEPFYLANVNGTLFFSAATDPDDRALWKSDGTAAGTVLVRDIHPGSYDNVQQIIAVDNQAVFVGLDSTGPKLFKSDGTSAGTRFISDFYSTDPINAGRAVFFAGIEDGVERLYKTNLTLESTMAVTPPVRPGSQPQKIFDVNGTGYFVADNGINGRELWKTDNTTAGTVLVKDILPGEKSSNPDQLTNVNGTLFFVANEKEIWKSNGTSAGTMRVKSVVASGSYDKITGLVELNGILFFGILTSTQSTQLWKSNGTAAGTVLITTWVNNFSSFEPVASNGQLYFLAWDGVNSAELWKSNGTAAGTSVVKDIAGSGGGNIGKPAIAGNYIYCILLDYKNNVTLLVKSDGTSAGTTVVKTFYLAENYPGTEELMTVGNLVYFNVFDTNKGREMLWRTDGTGAGTIQLADFDANFSSGGSIRHKTEAGGRFFFVPYNKKTGDQLWVSDGTPAGTKMVKKIGQSPYEFMISQTASVGDIMYFTPHDPETGTELWRSDGTSDGTYLVYDLGTNGGLRFYDLANVNGTLLISADAGRIGSELYKYQPAPAALRINSGGTAFTASGNRNFIADQDFSGITEISNAANGDILNTTDDQLYKEQRVGSNFNYSIPVTNEQINVVLHFAEISWGVPGQGDPAGTGKRRFHVDMEGSRKLTNYDIFVTAGGAMRARTETFTVNVTDDTLNISFLTGAADKPAIAAIEVLPMPPVIIGPLADAFVRNSPDYNTINFGVAKTVEIKTGSLSGYERNIYLKFPLNGISQVSSAKLRLYGSNTQTNANAGISAFGVDDDSWTETGITWNNAPAASGSVLGSVHVNNTAKYYEIDVTAFVQSQLADDKVAGFFITNPDNRNARLVFNSRENAANRPQLVIETMAMPAARMASEEEFVSSISKTETSNIYPNPVVGKQFSVKVSNLHEGNIDMQLVNVKGQSVQLRTRPAVTTSRVNMDIFPVNLSKGMYLLKIESKAHKEVVKMLVIE